MTDIDQRIAKLPPEKLALLMERLEKASSRDGSARRSETPGIQASDRLGPEPLSFAQERLWFLDRLAPGNTDYNVPGAFRVRGELPRVALGQALEEVLRRHEVLRTRFDELQGRPMQIVEPEMRGLLKHSDLTGLTSGIGEAESARLTREVTRTRFDLRRAPLVRVVAVRLANGHHTLLFALHHIVCDGWSMHLLMEEVLELVRAFSSGIPSPLAEPQYQYADFARWQRERVQGEKREEMVSYWKNQLRGASPDVGLEDLGDEPDPPDARPVELETTLPSQDVRELLRLGREEHATLFMTLVALFASALYVETEKTDVCLGANAANRGKLEAEDLIGFFVNQIVLRIRPDPVHTFRAMVRQARDVVSDAHAHQDLPFEQLVDLLRAEPGHDEAPLFRVKIELQDQGVGTTGLPGLALEPLELAWTPLRGDLLVTASESEREVVINWSYDAARIPSDTIRQWTESLGRTASLVAEAPDEPLETVAARIHQDRKHRQRQDRRRLQGLDATRLRRTRRRGVRLGEPTKG